MCQDCGCGDPELVSVELHESLLADNDRRAGHNREHFLAAGVTAINLMGSPGGGKTALLEATARAGGERWRLAAMSGDLATDRDARRLEAAGIAAVAVTTGSACHLDAALVHRALHGMDWRQRDLVFIENVGNLVCPAIYDLGQAANVVVLAVTEGEDKPLKYPVMFHHADLVVISKVDLLPHLPGFSLAALHENLAKVAGDLATLELSALTGQGLTAWMEWLETRRRSTPRPAAAGPVHHHHAHQTHQDHRDHHGHEPIEEVRP